ncbi:hypothetical protein OROMI_016819 [Orobanche minor]
MEQFIEEKISASLDMLSTMNDIVRVLEVIEGLGNYFKQSTDKLMKESPAYSEHDRAIRFLREGDEECLVSCTFSRKAPTECKVDE